MHTVISALIFILSFQALAASAPAASAKEISAIDLQLEKLTENVTKTKDKKLRIKMLNDFHSVLEKKTNPQVKDQAYWYATELSVKIETILDRDCKKSKDALILGDQNNIDGDNTTISKDTQKVLRLADAFCK